MPYVLDTTLLIDHAADRPTAVALVRRLLEETGELYTCDAVVAEACSRGSDEELAAIASMIQALEYVATHPDAARWAGEARRFAGRTSPRTLGDALIAGVAWSLGATVVTRNPDDFVRMGVPVLAYEAYEADEPA
jgi:predicted nucleic acid-binding protein